MGEQEQAPALYRHTQQGYLTAIALGVATVTQVGSLVRAVRDRKPHRWTYLPGIILTAGLAYTLSALTVEITREELIVGFRRGFLRRRIELTSIRSVEQIRVPWYWGWGMRLTPKGRLYNVQGRQAVHLELAGGRGVSIGSDEPERLRAAIEAIRPAT